MIEDAKRIKAFYQKKIDAGKTLNDEDTKSYLEARRRLAEAANAEKKAAAEALAAKTALTDGQKEILKREGAIKAKSRKADLAAEAIKYRLDLKDAGDNAKAKEIIEAEHQARLAEIKARWNKKDKAAQPKVDNAARNAADDESRNMVKRLADVQKFNEGQRQLAKDRVANEIKLTKEAIHELENAIQKSKNRIADLTKKQSENELRALEKAQAGYVKYAGVVTGVVNRSAVAMMTSDSTWAEKKKAILQDVSSTAISFAVEETTAQIAEMIRKQIFAEEIAAATRAQGIAAAAEAVATNGATAATITAQDAAPAAMAATMSWGSAAIIGGAALAGIIAMAASYDVGTPSVRGDQLANIHDGEAILPRGVSNAMRAGNWAPAMRFMGQSGGSSTTSTSSQTNHITVNVAGTNASPQAIAQVISRAIPIQQRKGARSSF